MLDQYCELHSLYLTMRMTAVYRHMSCLHTVFLTVAPCPHLVRTLLYQLLSCVLAL